MWGDSRSSFNLPAETGGRILLFFFTRKAIKEGERKEKEMICWMFTAVRDPGAENIPIVNRKDDSAITCSVDHQVIFSKHVALKARNK